MPRGGKLPPWCCLCGKRGMSSLEAAGALPRQGIQLACQVIPYSRCKGRGTSSYSRDECGTSACGCPKEWLLQCCKPFRFQRHQSPSTRYAVNMIKNNLLTSFQKVTEGTLRLVDCLCVWIKIDLSNRPCCFLSSIYDFLRLHTCYFYTAQWACLYQNISTGIRTILMHATKPPERHGVK
jgi:hypothetical protein